MEVTVCLLFLCTISLQWWYMRWSQNKIKRFGLLSIRYKCIEKDTKSEPLEFSIQSRAFFDHLCRYHLYIFVLVKNRWWGFFICSIKNLVFSVNHCIGNCIRFFSKRIANCRCIRLCKTKSPNKRFWRWSWLMFFKFAKLLSVFHLVLSTVVPAQMRLSYKVYWLA